MELTIITKKESRSICDKYKGLFGVNRNAEKMAHDMKLEYLGSREGKHYALDNLQNDSVE